MDYSGIEFPVDVKQFNKIEKQNQISINVFGYESFQPYPIYITKEKLKNNMDLLLLTGESEEVVMGKPSNKDLSAVLVL